MFGDWTTCSLISIIGGSLFSCPVSASFLEGGTHFVRVCSWVSFTNTSKSVGGPESSAIDDDVAVCLDDESVVVVAAGGVAGPYDAGAGEDDEVAVFSECGPAIGAPAIGARVP